MYPSPSDWNSGAANSAWIVRAGHVCQTTGWNFLLDLQTQLRYWLTDPLPSFDGASVTQDNVSVNDPNGTNSGWDPLLLRALWAVANRTGASSADLASISGDANGPGTVSPRTLAVAIWSADGLQQLLINGSGLGRIPGSPNDVTIPAGTVLPAFWTPPPVPSLNADAVGFDCHLVPTSNVANINTSTTPFHVNPWVVLGVLLAGAVAIGALTKNVPVKKRR